MEQHAEEKPGYGGDISDSFLFDGLEDPVEGEALHQDDPGADPERHQHVGGGPEGVEEGDDGESDVLSSSVRWAIVRRSRDWVRRL